MNIIGTAFLTFILCFFLVPMFLGLTRMFGVYTIVSEKQHHVYVLFGKVLGIIDEPGLHFLLPKLGWKALIVHWLGRRYVLDMRLDQKYLRSQQVNSEEGAPMGIGIWYEMYISDPVAYLFKNTDPEGSLAANVSNAVVRCLSNMPLASMLETRHSMSQTVRQEVSPKSHEWGYKLGSVYIRKVHFRDVGMIKQIEEKVVNRLRQVTSAIKQDGANQVSIITSTAERQAAIELARADAMRPQIIGEVLRDVCQDLEIAAALFETLEAQRILESPGHLTLIPPNSGFLAELLAAASGAPVPSAPPRDTHEPKREPPPKRPEPAVEPRKPVQDSLDQLKQAGQEAVAAYLNQARERAVSKLQPKKPVRLPPE